MSNSIRIGRYALHAFLLVFASISFAEMANAQETTASSAVVLGAAEKAGDKLFAKLKFTNAIKKYTQALASGSDTVRVTQKIADSYRVMGNIAQAEKWYAKIADNPAADAQAKYHYAEILRMGKNYTAAKKYYAASSSAKQEDLSAIDHLGPLAKDNIAYRIELLNINTSKADYSPAFYGADKLMFSSARSNKKSMYDKWSLNRYSGIYVAALDSTMKTDKARVKSACKTYQSSTTLSAAQNEVIYSAANFKKKNTTLQNGERLPYQQLYSSTITDGKLKKPVAMFAGATQYSCTQPSLSKDGQRLFFASDKPGGLGGTDIYVVARTADGQWTEPQNLGDKINSHFDEKYPFIATDGTLYFASNSLNGLGGLDIYKATFEDGQWSVAENLGAPVNSSYDDYALIIDSANKSGYFTSNRPGGMGEDDIYKFTYDESKLDYKVIVRVLNSGNQQPVEAATLALDCKSVEAENTLTDAKGEKIFKIKGGKKCVLLVSKPGYKSTTADISAKNKNTPVVVSLKPDLIKLNITVKEKETADPLRDVAISLTPAGLPPMNYATAESGSIEAALPMGRYTVSSPDFPSITAQFSDADTDPSGVVKMEFQIPHSELVVNVPLTANCFSSTVTVTDLKTGIKTDVAPNTNGEVRLDLRTNNRFVIEHNGRIDTISTVGLTPGESVDGPCKFFIGQTWIVNNIYYDLNKSNIRPDAAKELDNLVRVMKENPSLEIELSSHTDCRSSARYNMVLSAKRARAAVDYIVKRGVKSKRIIAAGFGETQPVNICICEPGNESPCTPEQHQANRRTEVKVLRY